MATAKLDSHFVDRERKRLTGELGIHKDPVAAQRHAVEQATKVPDGDPAAMVFSFLAATQAIKLNRQTGELTAKDLDRLEQLARTMLKLLDIPPAGSRLSFLHARLALILGLDALAHGRRHQAARHLDVVGLASKHRELTETTDELADEAEILFRLGRMARCAYAALQGESITHVEDLFFKQRIMRVAALRLGGMPQVALGLIDESMARDPGVIWRQRLEAQRAYAHLQLGDDPKTWLKAATKAGVPRDWEHLAQLSLWTKALRTDRHMHALPKARTIRETAQRQGLYDSVAKAKLDALEELEAAYDDASEATGPSTAMIAETLDALGNADPEWEILHAAAAWRLYLRKGLPSAAEMALDRYQSLSLAYTQNQHRDVLGLGTTEHQAPSAGIERVDMLTNAVVLSTGDFGSFKRAARMSALSAAVAKTAVKAKVLELFAGEEKKAELRAAELEAYGDVLKTFIEGAKGLTLKASQQVNFLKFVLPKEIANKIAEVKDIGSYVEFPTVERTFKSSLGQTLAQAFREFDPTPLASASIGQVHRAIGRDGRELAVKIQHPKIQDQVEGQLRYGTMLSPILSRVLPHVNVARLWSEIYEMVRVEWDYVREARMQTKFRDALAGDDRFVVPGIVPSLCSAHVLTAEFIEGRSFADFCKAAPQDEKNEAGSRIMYALYRCGYGAGLFNCDPHPGNFLFLPDGRLGLIDFGCSIEGETPGFTDHRSHYNLLREGHLEELRNAALKKGLIDGTTVNVEDYLDHLRHDYAPILEDRQFTFNRAHMERSYEHFAKVREAYNLTHGIVPFLRFIMGLHSVLTSLEATANFHAAIDPILGSPLPLLESKVG